MKTPDPNRENLYQVARALGDLREQAVFVGGSIVGLLLTDNAAPRPRPTDDVDVTLDIHPLSSWQTKLNPRLRELGFRETGNVICRWRVEGVLVDIMPARGEILGFSNRWYPEAIETAQEVTVGDLRVRVVTSAMFLATKIEAFNDRGNGDLQASHDAEDVFVVVDGRPDIVSDVAGASPGVRGFIADELRKWLAAADFPNALEGALEDGRDAIVQPRLQKITELG